MYIPLWGILVVVLIFGLLMWGFVRLLEKVHTLRDELARLEGGTAESEDSERGDAEGKG